MAEKIPLILLPGLLCDAALWQAQIAGLLDVAEPWIGDLTRDESLSAIARRVLDEVPPRFALAGLSMGGYVALEIMRQAPERVTRLALLDTSARADTPAQSARRRGMIELTHKGQFRGVTPRMLPLYLHPDHLGDCALAHAVIAMSERVGRDAYLRQQAAIMGRPDSRADLPNVKVPTLVLCGREDAATPLHLSEEIAAGIPGADLAVIERCGHLSTMEQPAQVTAAMRRWLVGSG